MSERSEQKKISHNHTIWKPKTAKDSKAGQFAKWHKYDFTMAQQNLKYLWICVEKYLVKAAIDIYIIELQITYCS